MYQYEKHLDCHALGQEIKRRRKTRPPFFEPYIGERTNGKQGAVAKVDE